MNVDLADLTLCMEGSTTAPSKGARSNSMAVFTAYCIDVESLTLD
jgi:hypothetical protein